MKYPFMEFSVGITENFISPKYIPATWPEIIKGMLNILVLIPKEKDNGIANLTKWYSTLTK